MFVSFYLFLSVLVLSAAASSSGLPDHEKQTHITIDGEKIRNVAEVVPYKPDRKGVLLPDYVLPKVDIDESENEQVTAEREAEEEIYAKGKLGKRIDQVSGNNLDRELQLSPDENHVESSCYSSSEAGSDSTNAEAFDAGEEGIDNYRKGGYHPISIGDLFRSRYRIEEKLGWGSFSTVWLAIDG